MSDARAAWSRYWAIGSSNGCLPAATAIRERLGAVWRELAATLPAGAELLDIAAGDGAVLRTLREANPKLALTGIDYAEVGPAACALGVIGGVDATALPFVDGRFAAVTSQFGIEYCPTAALGEAARVLAPGGGLRFVCHHAGSRAIAHNQGRLAAMRALIEGGLFTLARDIAAGRGEDARRATEIASVRRTHAGHGIVDELPQALGQALRGAQPALAVAMLEGKAIGEMARLVAMLDAALDERGVERMVGELRRAGVAATFEPLEGGGAPIAWLVAGLRGAG